MVDHLTQLNEIFQQLFEDDELVISRDTTAEDVEGWDSVMHVSLLIHVEKAFRIRFKSSEVAGLRNVGELIDLIDSRLKGS